MAAAKVAVIGDVHGFWDELDTSFFNGADYDWLLFTGDLARLVGGIADAAKLAELDTPTLLIPGNHDGVSLAQFIAELKSMRRLCTRFAAGQTRRMRHFERALGSTLLGGYTLHHCSLHGCRYGIISARPHSMGGDRLYFQPYLQARFDVGGVEESSARLCALVDQAPDHLIFLAHNGPSGLGSEISDPWGCDFEPGLGDFGDRDLRSAIDYAAAQGKRVRAVAAGHMHHHLKNSAGVRDWCAQRDGITYVNAARVPRIIADKSDPERMLRHHVRLEFDEREMTATQVWVADDGSVQGDQSMAGGRG